MPSVNWTSTITGYSGQGEIFNDSSILQAWVAYGNKEYPYIIHSIK
jgi:hypothetical protein